MEEDLLHFKLIFKVVENNTQQDTHNIIRQLKKEINQSALFNWLGSIGFNFYDDTDATDAISNIKITNCESIIHKFLRKRETSRVKKLSHECIKLYDNGKGTYVIITFTLNRREIHDMEMDLYFMIDEDLAYDEDGTLFYEHDNVRIINDDRVRTVSVIVRTPSPMQGGRKKKKTNKRRRALHKKTRKA
jgi:hypothetical protein